MSEKAMWAALRPLMLGLDPVRIENAVGVGTPDVNYALGWIELKYLAKWPERESTPLRIDHFTKAQRNFARQRVRAGGRVYFLLKVGKSEWLLMNGARAADTVGKETRAQFCRGCLARWTRKPTKRELQQWL